MLTKSEGHLAFIPDTHRGYWEYFASPDGRHVYRQCSSAPVMPDGRRSGRWFCPMWQWQKRETFPTVITAHMPATVDV